MAWAPGTHALRVSTSPGSSANRIASAPTNLLLHAERSVRRHISASTCADGYIANFDTKYYYNYWRPITAIRLGDTDGNPDTTGDPGWTPLLDTPPVPDYASGHSVQGGAMSEVLRLFFGTDNISFSTCSTTLPPGSTCNDASPVTRSFTSFSQAAAENGLSRILVGIHFRKAVTEGIKHGGKIAQHTFVHYLRPLR